MNPVTFPASGVPVLDGAPRRQDELGKPDIERHCSDRLRGNMRNGSGRTVRAAFPVGGRKSQGFRTDRNGTNPVSTQAKRASAGRRTVMLMSSLTAHDDLARRARDPDVGDPEGDDRQRQRRDPRAARIAARRGALRRRVRRIERARVLAHQERQAGPGHSVRAHGRPARPPGAVDAEARRRARAAFRSSPTRRNTTAAPTKQTRRPSTSDVEIFTPAAGPRMN